MGDDIFESLKRIEKFIEKDKTIDRLLKLKLRTKQNRKKWAMYLRYIEDILSKFNSLKAKVRRDELDIEDLKKEQVHKDLYYEPHPPEGPDIDDETRHLQKIRRRWRSMVRKKKLIERFEKALDEIKADEYYRIIELKYFNHLSVGEIAKRIPCNERTVMRQSKRLINELIVIYYGAEALGG